MQFGKPTQILLATTTGLTTSTRKLDHPSKIAWNLLTGLYFKVEGLPWGPTELTPGSCHIGISFLPAARGDLDAANQRRPGVRLERRGPRPAGPQVPLGRGEGRPLAAPASRAGPATRRYGPGAIPQGERGPPAACGS